MEKLALIDSDFYQNDSGIHVLPQVKDMKVYQRRVAFTLAEVLITLGIIGVVAAMTIPNLMANIRAHQYTTKLKKVISTLAQAGRMAQAEYGFDYAGVSSTCRKTSGTDHPDSKQTVCALLNGTLTGATFVYGLENLPDYKFTSSTFDNANSFGSSSNNLPIYLLSDGSIIVLSSAFGAKPQYPCTFNIALNSASSGGTEDTASWGNGCYAMVDVNGLAGPNKETKCSNGVGTNLTGVLGRPRGAGNCVVKNKDIGDIFFVGLYDSIAEPQTNATWYVYNNAK